MAEKTFSIDLEETLHGRARRLGLDRGVPVKALYSEAITALLDARPPVVPAKPAASSPQDKWHRMLDEILESGDREAISAVQQNILVFHRIVGAETPAEKRGKKRA